RILVEGSGNVAIENNLILGPITTGPETSFASITNNIILLGLQRQAGDIHLRNNYFRGSLNAGNEPGDLVLEGNIIALHDVSSINIGLNPTARISNNTILKYNNRSINS